MTVLAEGIVFGESPRWHDGRLWFSDWGAGRVCRRRRQPRGPRAEVAPLPMCIDFLPDGRLLVVSAAVGGLLRREPDGSLVTHAELSAVGQRLERHRGRRPGPRLREQHRVRLPRWEFAPGLVALVDVDGSTRVVAEELAFPNGMAISPDGSTLLVAESYGEQLTAYPIAADGTLGDARTWAATPGDHPDGICFDASGALWYADVGNEHCVRVREGGEVLDTVDSDRGAFACAESDDPRCCSSSASSGAATPQPGPPGRSWCSRHQHTVPAAHSRYLAEPVASGQECRYDRREHPPPDHRAGRAADQPRAALAVGGPTTTGWRRGRQKCPWTSAGPAAGSATLDGRGAYSRTVGDKASPVGEVEGYLQ